MDVYILVKETSTTDIIINRKSKWVREKAKTPRTKETYHISPAGNAGRSSLQQPEKRTCCPGTPAVWQQSFERETEISWPSVVTAFRSFPSQPRLQPRQTYTVTTS